MTFLIETKRASGLELPIAYTLEFMLRSMRHGNVIIFENELRTVVGMVGYTIGTIFEEFEDTHVVFVEYCLKAPQLQGNFYFLFALHFLAETIIQEHSEVHLFKCAARQDDHRNNRLYSKFAKKTEQYLSEDDTVFNVYTTTVQQLHTYVDHVMKSRKLKQ